MTFQPVFLTPDAFVEGAPTPLAGADGVFERDFVLEGGDGRRLAATVSAPAAMKPRVLPIIHDAEMDAGQSTDSNTDAPAPTDGDTAAKHAGMNKDESVSADGAVTGVVLLHGWGGTRCGPHRMFVRLGRALARSGLAALRFDLSGRGLSDGEVEAIDLDAMIEDALAARAWLRRAGCAGVSFAGICSGGNVAIGAAAVAAATAGEGEARRSENVRLALLSTLPFHARSAGMASRKRRKVLGQYLRRALQPSTWLRLLRGEIDPSGLRRTMAAAGAESGEERRLKDSRRDLPALWAAGGIPALFVYGEGDPEAAPAWEHYKAFSQAGGPAARVLWIENANHNFYAAEWSARAEAAVVEYLNAQCTMRPRHA